MFLKSSSRGSSGFNFASSRRSSFVFSSRGIGTVIFTSMISSPRTPSFVADGTPCRQANATARMLRERLNALFASRGLPWLAYGEFSGFRLLPGYDGPRPTGDDFVPYAGAIDELDTPRPPRLTQTFRQAMLLPARKQPAWLLEAASRAEREVGA